MTRRLLLFATLATLPGAGLSAQIGPSGGARHDPRGESSDERARRDRDSRKGGGAFAAGLSLGGGLVFSSADSETGAQGDWCIGACAPLRMAVRHAAPYALLPAGAANGRDDGDTGAAGAGRGGVLALLGEMGVVSDEALDALRSAPGQGNANAGESRGNSGAAAARSKRGNGAGQRNAYAYGHDLAHNAADFLQTVNGCVIGCEGSSGNVYQGSIHGSGSGTLFVSGNGIGPALQLTGDVNTLVNPEPGTIALTLVGLAAVAGVRRRTQRTR